MCLGWTTEKALRGSKKRTFPGHKKAVTSWQRAKERNEGHQLGNLSFFTHYFEFDEDGFRNILRTTETEFVKKYVLPDYDGDEDEVVKVVKRWVEKGIPATTEV
jgi:hypothetical protein